MKPCYVFDVDGTLADLTHRKHLISKTDEKKPDWRAFFAACDQDAPIKHMIEVAQDLSAAGKEFLYVSGRSDECRTKTARWLATHGLPDGKLYMRKEGDYRSDDIVKLELLKQILAESYRPILVFDDRDRVVKMWRENGVPCAQVSEGDF